MTSITTLLKKILTLNCYLLTQTVLRMKSNQKMFIYCRNFKFCLHPLKSIKKVFPEVLIVIFRNGPSLKDYLVRLAFPRMINSRGSDLCEIGTYQACGHITTTNTFTTKVCVEVFKIQNGSLNCNSEKALYLLRCKVYDDTPYIRKAKTNLCLRFNNCKSEHRFCVVIMSHMRSLYYFVVV